MFQGASYFRAVGKGQSYGLSARGLAVDTAAPSGEEFPRFVEFWIERPRAGATSLTIYALLDSRRVTGAYRFVLTPGVETTMQVTARLFLREAIGKLGLAPLTSMFTFGENQPGRDDYRPEVHDSDGLSIQLGDGEWIWRPLVNPRRLLVTSFAHDQSARLRPDAARPLARELRGSGGALRPAAERLDRADRQLGCRPGRAGADPDARRDQRQHRRLLGARQALPAAGKPLDIAYRVHWQAAGTVPAGKGWVVQTRRGRGFARKARRRYPVRRRLRRSGAAFARRADRRRSR